MPARLRLGLELGGTSARAALVDEGSGAVAASSTEPLLERTPLSVVRTLGEVARRTAAQAGLALSGLPGGGVGVAGRCHGASGTVSSAPALGWRDVPLGALLGAELGRPVRVVGEHSAAAWGERAFGAARGLDDVALVVVGAGVGAGLVLGGRLHEGGQGVAGELGHTKVAVRGTTPRPCACGEWGCLEAYAGGTSLAARLREALSDGRAAAVLAAAGDASSLSAAAVEVAYQAGDPYARELFAEIGELLGTAVANLCTLLNPSVVVLGGEVLRGCPNLLRIARAHLADKAFRPARQGFRVELAGLGGDAGVVGASLLRRSPGDPNLQ